MQVWFLRELLDSIAFARASLVAFPAVIDAIRIEDAPTGSET